jgi:hypothetical protein
LCIARKGGERHITVWAESKNTFWKLFVEGAAHNQKQEHHFWRFFGFLERDGISRETQSKVLGVDSTQDRFGHEGSRY